MSALDLDAIKKDVRRQTKNGHRYLANMEPKVVRALIAEVERLTEREDDLLDKLYREAEREEGARGRAEAAEQRADAYREVAQQLHERLVCRRGFACDTPVTDAADEPVLAAFDALEKELGAYEGEPTQDAQEGAND